RRPRAEDRRDRRRAGRRRQVHHLPDARRAPRLPAARHRSALPRRGARRAAEGRLVGRRAGARRPRGRAGRRLPHGRHEKSGSYGRGGCVGGGARAGHLGGRVARVRAPRGAPGASRAAAAHGRVRRCRRRRTRRRYGGVSRRRGEVLLDRGARRARPPTVDRAQRRRGGHRRDHGPRRHDRQGPPRRDADDGAPPAGARRAEGGLHPPVARGGRVGDGAHDPSPGKRWLTNPRTHAISSLRFRAKAKQRKETPKGMQVENHRGEEESFAQLFEESLKHDVSKEGEIVTGTVIQVTKDYVVVDIGYKSEGQVPIAEFQSAGGEVAVKPGDKIDVLLESRDNENGLVVLSREKADRLKVWDDISQACERDELIEGTIAARVKGGLSVAIRGGVKAFLPGSQVDLRPVRNLDAFIGKTYKFKVIKFN